MKAQFLLLLLFILISCKNVIIIEKEEVQNLENYQELKQGSDKKQTGNLALIDFLEYPIDLQSFKQSKDLKYTTSGVCNAKDYYFKPNINDSIHYIYNFHYPTSNGGKKSNHIVIFKYGENKHRYDDKNEILIELKVLTNDPDLGSADLVGISREGLETKFGIDYLKIDQRIIYSNRNKILILELYNDKVKSYNYIKLHSESISNELLMQIVK